MLFCLIEPSIPVAVPRPPTMHAIPPLADGRLVDGRGIREFVTSKDPPLPAIFSCTSAPIDRSSLNNRHVTSGRDNFIGARILEALRPKLFHSQTPNSNNRVEATPHRPCPICSHAGVVGVTAGMGIITCASCNISCLGSGSYFFPTVTLDVWYEYRGDGIRREFLKFGSLRWEVPLIQDKEILPFIPSQSPSVLCWLVAVAADRVAYCWDITSCKPHLIETFIGHTSKITVLVFSSLS